MSEESDLANLSSIDDETMSGSIEEDDNLGYSAVCDYCGENSTISSFCEDGLDAVYCSEECLFSHKEQHASICTKDGFDLLFCSYCNVRVKHTDLCDKCSCFYLCKACTSFHTDDCGKKGAKWDKLLEIFTDVEHDDDIIETIKEAIICSDEMIFLVNLKYKDGKVDMRDFVVTNCDADDSNYYKYAQLDSILGCLLSASNQTIIRTPFIVQIMDPDTNDLLCEQICYFK